MDLVEYRAGVIERLTEKARKDERIVAAAAVGSTAVGGDRWSDVDLTFAVAEGATVAEVLAEWTRDVVADFGAAELFDLGAGATTYRVFLFPRVLQVDLSFAPAAGFAPRTPRFRLLFGEAGELAETTAAPPPGEFGLGVHHVIRVHVCIEREKFVQAEYWLHQARDIALTLACRRLGLDTQYGRSFDDLPASVIDPIMGAGVGTSAGGTPPRPERGDRRTAGGGRMVGFKCRARWGDPERIAQRRFITARRRLALCRPLPDG